MSHTHEVPARQGWGSEFLPLRFQGGRASIHFPDFSPRLSWGRTICATYATPGALSQTHVRYLDLRQGAQRSLCRLSLIVNNSRFLILPHVRVPHLASHILGTILRRLRCDWQRKYHLAPCLRLSEMAPEVEALRAQNTSLHRQLEVKTKRIAELREALEAARARCAPSGCSFPHRATKARGWCPSGRGASTDIPVPSATSPITSMSTLRSNSVRAHTVVACSSRTRMRSSS